MNLTSKVKLITSKSQKELLLEILERVNLACNLTSQEAWDAKEFKQFSIHKLTYYRIREIFNLPSNIAICCISKVSDTYKLDNKVKRTFKIHGAIHYNHQILRWDLKNQTVSIRVLDKRIIIPFVCGSKQLAMLHAERGETKLIYKKGEFYLAAACKIPEPIPDEVTEYLGVDLGIANIATTSDGQRFCGKELKGVRYRHRRLRAKLQKKGTRAAKRRLKKLSGKESNFARHTNHVISKQIVEKAKGTGKGIAVEELTNIRERVTVRKKQRVVLHSWSFAQLRAFITYKAALFGVPLVSVNPRNTSRECSHCGHIDKRNRTNQSTFRCLACGHVEHADINASRVIAGRASCKLAEVHKNRLSDRVDV